MATVADSNYLSISKQLTENILNDLSPPLNHTCLSGFKPSLRLMCWNTWSPESDTVSRGL